MTICIEFLFFCYHFLVFLIDAMDLYLIESWISWFFLNVSTHIRSMRVLSCPMPWLLIGDFSFWVCITF